VGYSPYRIKRFPLQLIKIALLYILKYGSLLLALSKNNVKTKKKWSFATQGSIASNYMGVNMATKEYVLRIGFDPITEEVTYIKEYIDKSHATLHVGDEDIELDDEVSDYIVGDIMGIT
tara:strand:+ start:163 stop:519 length:357 start_codon:yes stop_codon:yes gene_type:complete